MPAVELGRLQQQVNRLSDLFQQPTAYLRGVEDLLRDHGVPAHRQGRVKSLRPILISYEVPPPLLKLLSLEMNTQANQYPSEALAIADGLWSRQTLETHQLAIRLLGSIPGSLDEISGRLETWAHENREQLLVPELSENGTRTLRMNYPEELLEIGARMLDSGDSRKQVLAIGVFLKLANERQLTNLPRLLEILGNPVRDPDRKIRPELANLLIALAQLSPKETEFFLLQILEDSPTESTRWLVRQASRALPEDGQARLRSALT